MPDDKDKKEMPRLVFFLPGEKDNSETPPVDNDPAQTAELLAVEKALTSENLAPQIVLQKVISRDNNG